MISIRAARAEARGAFNRVSATLRGERGVLPRLKQEHGAVRSLCNQVAGAWGEQVHVRGELFPRIRMELLCHANAEEEVVYAMASRFPTTRDVAIHAIEEHEEMKQLIRRLERMDITTPQWMATFLLLRSCLERHVDAEERLLLPKLRAAMDREQGRALEARYLDERARQRGILLQAERGAQARGRAT
jgi:iron-sulfur cluster repair protein YtfE (RIC family)